MVEHLKLLKKQGFFSCFNLKERADLNVLPSHSRKNSRVAGRQRVAHSRCVWIRPADDVIMFCDSQSQLLCNGDAKITIKFLLASVAPTPFFWCLILCCLLFYLQHFLSALSSFFFLFLTLCYNDILCLTLKAKHFSTEGTPEGRTKFSYSALSSIRQRPRRWTFLCVCVCVVKAGSYCISSCTSEAGMLWAYVMSYCYLLFIAPHVFNVIWNRGVVIF